MKTKLTLTAIAIFVSMLGVPCVQAATGIIANATVFRVMITSDATFGGCMAALAVNPATQLPGCGDWWVTFSCSGDFTDPARAYRMLDEAQLAYATGRKVYVQFTDDKKHNGYCFVTRIDGQ